MNPTAAFHAALPTLAAILATMGLVAAIETAIPLHARGRWNRVHLAPNLALTFLTFATNLFFNAAVLAGLATFDGGLLRAFALPSLAATAITIAVLDFSFYVAHRAMHRIPLFWRFHRVHHADPAVDVTTTIRQHPGEGVIRYAFLGAFAMALGATPQAFAIYRLWSVLNGLFEHANIRLPLQLDSLLALVTTSPNMHKIHHSRLPAQTDTNYGNIFSIFDRAFGTFTPAARGVDVECGLDGFDDEKTQSLAGLLALPFEAGGGRSYESLRAISTGTPVMKA